MTNRSLSSALDSQANNLDFIRYFLAASVCFTHSFNLLYGDNTDPLGLATGVVGLGGTAVNIFFMISGLLITKSWFDSKGALDFILKRLLRIYPAFITTSLACAFVFGPIGAADSAAYFDEFRTKPFIRDLLHLTPPRLPATFPNAAFPNQVNGSLWTISYEFKCYIYVLIAGILRLLGVRGLSLAAFFIATFLLFLQHNLQIHPTWRTHFSPEFLEALRQLDNWPRFSCYFLCGINIYLFREKISLSRTKLWVSVIFLSFSIFQLRQPDIGVCLLGSYLLLHTAYSRTLQWHDFGKNGDYSYGVYLYSFPVQQVLAMSMGQHLNGLSMFIVSLIISTFLAALSWRFIESPALQARKRVLLTCEAFVTRIKGVIRSHLASQSKR